MSSATGPSDARFETTAAWQAAETSNVPLQKEVEKNARIAHDVAEQAASEAEFKVPSTGRAVDQLEEGLAGKTNEAAAEGKSSVDSAKATASGYVEQARNIAGSAMATAAEYMPSSFSGSTTNSSSAPRTTGETGSNVMASLQSAAGTAVETAKNVLNTAQQTAQPHVERAINAAQPYVETAINKVSGTVGDVPASATASKPSEPPATTAPLESKGGVVGGPYPETATGGKSNVGSV